MDHNETPLTEGPPVDTQPTIAMIELDIQELYEIAYPSGGSLSSRLSFYMGLIVLQTNDPLYGDPATDQLMLLMLEQKRRMTLAGLIYIMFWPKPRKS